MHHVRTDAAGRSGLADEASSVSAHVRRAVRSLHIAGAQRDWASRPLPSTAARKTEVDPLVRQLAELRAAVTAYVRQLEAEGARPEQMLVRVKAVVRGAMSGDSWNDPAALRTITAVAVRWSIGAYYDRARDR